MDLVERVALITGGKRIGAVVAIELARRGADIALVYRESRIRSRGDRGRGSGTRPAGGHASGGPLVP